MAAKLEQEIDGKQSYESKNLAGSGDNIAPSKNGLILYPVTGTEDPQIQKLDSEDFDG